MVNSRRTRVRREFTVVLIFLVEAGISWSVPELLYLRVLKNISKVTNSPVPADIEKYFESYKQPSNLAYQPQRPTRIMNLVKAL
jgi:hypothetical protein